MARLVRATHALRRQALIRQTVSGSSSLRAFLGGPNKSGHDDAV
jgi:hypothetical protein